MSAPRAFYRPELDILRFFAFLGVYIIHIAPYPVEVLEQHRVPHAIAEMAMAMVHGGVYGVDLFFVLSAYLITELLLREKESRGHLNVPAFYLRRALRIWPLYYVAVLIAAYVPLFNPSHDFSGFYLAAFLLFIGNWSFVWFGWINTVAAPLWSVSIEEQFYIFWPPLVARMSRRGIAYAAVIMIAIANGSRLLGAAMNEGKEHLWANTFAHLDSIAAGILVALLLGGKAVPLRASQRILLIIFCVGCFSVRGYYHVTPGNDRLSMSGTLIGYPAVVAGCVAMLVAFIGMPFRCAPLQYLGKISYGLYVYHVGCLLITDELVTTNPGVMHTLIRTFAALALTVMVSAASYAVVERPFLMLKRRFTVVESRPV
ncbi:MAG TPA: acyltransferase [Steroidobacteraceae bacterium]